MIVTTHSKGSRASRDPSIIYLKPDTHSSLIFSSSPSTTTTTNTATNATTTTTPLPLHPDPNPHHHHHHNTMSEVLTVIYRPHEHADEYLVFVDDENEYKEWKAQPEGGKSVALSRFVGNFAIVSLLSMTPAPALAGILGD